MNVAELIAASGDRLTPTERRIAGAVLADPTLLAFGTVSNLAERVGTSRPSIVRFATKLGFGGYSALQEEVREGLSKRLSRPSQRIRQQAEQTEPARDTLALALSAVFDTLDDAKATALATPIARAEHLWILSGETSRAGAYTFHSGITMIRPNVCLVEEHSMGRDLSCAVPGDVAVVFDFARYRRHAITAARLLVEQGVELVAITDGPLSPLAALTETWCGLRVPGVGPFDSSVPAVAAAEILVARVAMILRDEARDRIDRTEALWEATDTFLP